MGAFHAYDIRGKYNVDFDKDTVYKVGYFLPELLKVDKVLVGRDMRLSSDEIHDYLLKGITDAGADVYDIGLATTPYVYYATAFKGFGASVQITASHNPKNDNGLKVSRENALPVGYDNGLGEIERWIKECRPTPVAQRRGSVNIVDYRQDYLDFQRKWLGNLDGLKISMDLSNGASALFVKELFKGADIEWLCDTLDGSFPNHEPNPLVAENREMLRKHLLANKSDIGVIYDGDADRVMFIDENGRFVSPDLLIAILGHFFIEGKGTSKAAAAIRENAANRTAEVKVLQDIRSSKAVGEYLLPMGGIINTWKVGRAYAAPRLREIDGLFGGELAGHYYFKDFSYSDSGIMASLIILDIVASFAREGVKFSELVSRVEKYKNSGEINFKIDRKRDAMDAVRDYFTSKEKPVASFDFDGYRVEFPQWWFNIRPSNTEPYLRFICEAANDEILSEKVAKVREIVESLQ
ncbi:MAG: phosphomannomutase/phosphoglucomutase [Candidatus Coprenecus sp.]|nr:phosphomannomutase/phosphoglucomutase [Candidatus Coprenecus sp.]